MALPIPSVHYPFDETPGAATARDYGAGAKNLTINDGEFIKGRVQNALYFEEDGSAEAPQDSVDFAANFTFMGWFRVWSAINSASAYLQYSIENPETPGQVFVSVLGNLLSWTHIAMTRAGDVLSVYVNGSLAGTASAGAGWGNPVGLGIVADDGRNYGGYCAMDDVRIYNGVAFSNQQLADLLSETSPEFFLRYTINGVDFTSLGVEVSASRGLHDALAMKDPLSFDWEDYHGEILDLNNPTYQARDIELDCFISGVGFDGFNEAIHAFTAHFQQAGTQRLALFAGIRPLVFELYLRDGIQIQKAYRPETNVGTFTLKLREPSPVKRVHKFVSQGAGANIVSLTISSKKMMTISWGDGSANKNVYGESLTLNHTYAQAGDYYIVAAGNVEQVTEYNINADEVWNKLQ